jgi:hypothetical protein
MTRILALSLVAASLTLPNAGATWKRHTIDGPDQAAGKSGADGVRLADANDDGLMDITTGWEEGGAVRVYLNPGPEQAKSPWPAVTVGHAKSVEDAVFADLDDDGNLDVVSATEGKNRTVYVHWAPNQSRYLDPKAWITQAIPATAGLQMWMFCLPANIDNSNGIDLVLGSKNDNAAIGWLESPAHPRDLDAWKYHRLHDAVWIMSICSMDQDKGLNLIYSDRKGPESGVYQLTTPSPNAAWKRTLLTGGGDEVMFLDLIPNNASPLVAVARKGAPVLTPDTDYPLPKNAGTGKAVRSALINSDARPDIVLTCENAKGNLSGVWWHNGARWHDISGPEGVKYDRIELLDLDSDGDLDLITCEERTNLGVIWFENPAN